MVYPEHILSRLPPYCDEWELITPQQYVPDIIREICTAHVLFADYYDEFSDLFYNSDAEKVAEELHWFCKNFIRYKAETVKKQTSALPTGMLIRGFGDCKHYALFSAGVISSLNRLYGCGIDWCFYFAGYEGADEPYHVYVCVKGDTDLWLDPTPGSGGEPSVLIAKRV